MGVYLGVVYTVVCETPYAPSTSSYTHKHKDRNMRVGLHIGAWMSSDRYTGPCSIHLLLKGWFGLRSKIFYVHSLHM